jgi:hypothetical protein
LWEMHILQPLVLGLSCLWVLMEFSLSLG